MIYIRILVNQVKENDLNIAIGHTLLYTSTFLFKIWFIFTSLSVAVIFYQNILFMISK